MFATTSKSLFDEGSSVVVGCHNSQSSKGVRLQIDDPAAITFNENFRVSLQSVRPCSLISCELTKRTEVLAVDLIRRYLSNGLSYDDMALHAEVVSDRELQLWEKWKSERCL